MIIKNISKFKVDYRILIPIFIFFLISIISIYSTKELLSSEYQYLWIKQIVWYGIGVIFAYLMMFLGNKFLYNNAYIFYIIGVILLGLVLILGVEVNNAKCWFKIPFLGTFQPSEFMKVFLIITLARMINDFNFKYLNPDIWDEFKFILKVLILLLIPSILTFIEPDTGAVIMYLIIAFWMLFIGGIRKRWFVITIIFFTLAIGVILSIYYLNQDMFTSIFGANLLYRMDRITNWSASDGLQLNNSLIAIGSAGLVGHGINHTPIYFPEMQTDFIFSVFSSNTGFLGSIFLFGTIIYFDIILVMMANIALNYQDKYAIGGILGVLIFQQVYNISMTLGILPIMGITLPFISYGGSSLLSYMILLGIIFNVSNANLRYKNK